MWAVIDGMPPSETMSEGMPHSDTKMAVVDRLRRFFRNSNRGILIAAELAVLYPGEHSFVPDILAVRDTELRRRNAWIVMDEGQGPDLILEIRNKGRRAEDYVRNVSWFARLGIPEYFVYDCLRGEIAAYRLPTKTAARHEPIIPQGGRYHSEVLDLDLSVADAALDRRGRTRDRPGRRPAGRHSRAPLIARCGPGRRDGRLHRGGRRGR